MQVKSNSHEKRETCLRKTRVVLDWYPFLFSNSMVKKVSSRMKKGQGNLIFPKRGKKHIFHSKSGREKEIEVSWDQMEFSRANNESDT